MGEITLAFREYELESILVTGSEGFIGKHLCRTLKKAGYKVLKYDAVNGDDVTDEVNVHGAVSRVKRVIHLGGIAHLEQCQDDPLRAINTNIMGTANLLQACVKHKVYFNYISSQYVFSREGGIYKCTKKACEDLIREYHKQYGLKFTIIRCGSVYGVGADKNNFIHRLITAELKDIEPVRGNPNDLREYINVKDVVRGILKTFSAKFVNKSVLLAGLVPLKTHIIYKTIREILGRDDGATFARSTRTNHYEATPYAYEEIENDKLILDSYVDLGSGLLEMIKEIKRGKRSRSRNDRF